MPLDLRSLAALRDLAAPADPRPLPRGLLLRRSPARPSDGAAFPRRRVASLAAGAAAAGLVCGLAGPSPAALAEPLATAWRTTLQPVVDPTSVSAQGADPVVALPSTGASASAQPSGAVPTSAGEAIAAVAGALREGLGAGQVPAAAAVPAAAPAWKVTRALPARSGTGRRIVYAQRLAHVWVVDADGTVLRDYKVTGRPGRPKPGTYAVFSTSRFAANPGQKLRFELMVRFAHGITGAAIGFHTIPRTYEGKAIQAESDLGRAIGSGGCVRQSRTDARWLWSWVEIGDKVVVLR